MLLKEPSLKCFCRTSGTFLSQNFQSNSFSPNFFPDFGVIIVPSISKEIYPVINEGSTEAGREGGGEGGQVYKKQLMNYF